MEVGALRERRSKVFLTFDIEGPAPHEDVVEERTLFILQRILESLKRNGLTGLFFLPASVAEALANHNEIIELLRSHQIGYHATTHSIRPLILEYTDVPDYKMAIEVSLRREQASIDQATGEIKGEGGLLSLRKMFPEKQIVAFRAPFDCWSPPHLEALKSLGMCYDFSSTITSYPTSHRGMTFFPPPMTLDGIPNIIGSMERTRSETHYFRMRALLSTLMRNACTVVAMHPARFVFKTRRRYLEKNVENYPRDSTDVAIRLIVVDLLFKQLGILQRMGLVEVTPQLETAEKGKRDFDVGEIYLQSVYRPSRLFSYKPKFLYSHFERFFDLDDVSTSLRGMREQRKLDGVQRRIAGKIKAQVQGNLELKSGYRKKMKRVLEKRARRLLYKMFTSNVEVEPYRVGSSFGRDELGRDVEKGLYKYVELLKERDLTIHTILVLGSRAKGTWDTESDVDVTIISDCCPRKANNFVTRRMRNLIVGFSFSDIPLCLGIEPSGCYTKAQFLKSLKQFDVQALDAVLYGRVIYDDGFWATAKKEYKEMEKRFRLDMIPVKKILRAL
jgi:hypothetical protein